MKEIISSLDIGSSTIKLVVGEVVNSNVNILAVSEVKSKGVKKGMIVNPDEALDSIKTTFAKAETSLGIKLNKVILTIPNYYAEYIITEGSTTITNETNTVEAHDIVRALQACVYNKVPDNKEFVAVTPIEYKVDDKKTTDPRGSKASKLSCKAMLSLVPKKNVYNAISLLDSIGIKVVDINFGSVGDYFEFKDQNMDKKNTAVINIGDEKTEVSIFKKGILIESECIEIGGKNIDRDICYIYDISRKKTKNLKEKFALATKRNASTSWCEEVLTNTGENIKINQYEISEIIHSRIKEILELSKKQINLLTKIEISYIIIVGGTTELTDFNLVVSSVFGHDMDAYKVNEIGCRHNKFSSSIGLIKYYHDKLSFRNRIASTVDAEYQDELINNNKGNNGNLFGKISGYFFNN